MLLSFYGSGTDGVRSQRLGMGYLAVRGVGRILCRGCWTPRDSRLAPLRTAHLTRSRRSGEKSIQKTLSDSPVTTTSGVVENPMSRVNRELTGDEDGTTVMERNFVNYQVGPFYRVRVVDRTDTYV